MGTVGGSGEATTTDAAGDATPPPLTIQKGLRTIEFHHQGSNSSFRPPPPSTSCSTEEEGEEEEGSGLQYNTGRRYQHREIVRLQLPLPQSLPLSSSLQQKEGEGGVGSTTRDDLWLLLSDVTSQLRRIEPSTGYFVENYNPVTLRRDSGYPEPDMMLAMAMC